MDYILITYALPPEGETAATSEPPEARHDGEHSYAGEHAVWIAEDETIIEVSRQERIGHVSMAFSE